MPFPRAGLPRSVSPLLSRRLLSTTAKPNPSPKPVSLLTPSDLAQLLASPEPPVVLDASWHMPAAGRYPWAEFRHRRIEGSGFWDV